MKKLIITEKPSVAMEFAAALGVSGKRSNGYLEDDDTVITWCVGHLVTMSYPEKYDPDLKKWNMDDLPFLPKQYLYEPIENTRAQFDVVSGLLNRGDIGKIYYAGDSAREGEYIQRLVRMISGRNEAAEEYRVWIDSQTSEEIQRGMREAKPLSDYDLLSDAAYARAIEDYAVGINFSRAITLKYADIAANAAGLQHTSIAVGRVMSCVLGMVVRREREIRGHVKTEYFGIDALVGDLPVTAAWHPKKGSSFYSDADLYEKGGFINSPLALQFIQKMPEQLTLFEKSFKTTKKNAPLLFNLAELQSECTKRFKMSPSETLEAAQSLYEKKLTTYPRTDARVLTNAVAKQVDKNISGLQKILEYADYSNNILNSGSWKQIANTRYTDDSAVSDHYAIIPTGNIGNYGILEDRDKKVFDLICRRFLSIFYPAAEYEEMNADFSGNGESFGVSAKALRKEGWMEIAGVPAKDQKEEDLMSAVRGMDEGKAYAAKYEIHPKETKPPARYTTGSMILAMENAGRLIEDEELREQIKGSGIGTSATRAETIKKLIKNGYIESNKQQVISPTMLGEAIYETLMLSLPDVLSPDITANWEMGLSQIEHGQITKEQYLGILNGFVFKNINKIKETDESGRLRENLKPLYKVYGVKEEKPAVKAGSEDADGSLRCPMCREPLKKIAAGNYAGSYVCSAGCGFKLWNTYAGKKLSDHTLKSLIKNGVTDSAVKNLTAKSGNKYDAKLRLDENGKVKPFFENKR